MTGGLRGVWLSEAKSIVLPHCLFKVTKANYVYWTPSLQSRRFDSTTTPPLWSRLMSSRFRRATHARTHVANKWTEWARNLTHTHPLRATGAHCDPRRAGFGHTAPAHSPQVETPSVEPHDADWSQDMWRDANHDDSVSKKSTKTCSVKEMIVVEWWCLNKIAYIGLMQ